MEKFRILLDMDELLTDFVSGACEAFGTTKVEVLRHWTPGVWDIVPPLSAAKGYPISDAEFWSVIHNRGSIFWRDLCEHDWAADLIKFVESITDDWYIVSKPSPCRTSHYGKIDWLRNRFGESYDRFILTPHKHLLAKPDVVLIDDSEANVEKFIAAGGDGIIFPAHHNGLYRLKDNPVLHVINLFSEKNRAH